METTKEIFKKMVAILGDIEAIGKTNTNETQKYKFRGIDDVYNAVHPLFKKHGVFCSTEIVDSKREERQSKSGGTNIWTLLTIKFSYWASDGSKVESITQGEAMDSGDKGSNKAMSAAQKYSIIQMFSIPTIEGANDIEKDDGELDKILNEILKFTDKKSLKDYANELNEYHKNKKFIQAVQVQLNKLK